MTGRARRQRRGGAWLVVLALAFALAGCRRETRPQPPPPAQIPDDGGAFTVAESMLDTWNTIGQVLVGLEGVGYEGRAQMLGLYVVSYRGEHFLLRTRALPVEASGQGLRTRVDALGPRGQPIRSRAAAALLAILEQRLPLEVARYRQPVIVPRGD